MDNWNQLIKGFDSAQPDKETQNRLELILSDVFVNDVILSGVEGCFPTSTTVDPNKY